MASAARLQWAWSYRVTVRALRSTLRQVAAGAGGIVSRRHRARPIAQRCAGRPEPSATGILALLAVPGGQASDGAHQSAAAVWSNAGTHFSSTGACDCEVNVVAQGRQSCEPWPLAFAVCLRGLWARRWLRWSKALASASAIFEQNFWKTF